jgi:hypothetical protein
MKAMLNAVKKFNQSVTDDKKIKSVACTGLGTFYGKMELSEASRQMSLAYKNFLNPPKKITWSFASERQEEVGYGGFHGLLKVKRSSESQNSRSSIVGIMSDLAVQTHGTSILLL